VKVMIVGATGAVGKVVLAAALENTRIEKVIAPTRRPLPVHAKLLNPIVDFTQLPADALWWKVDGVVCALGTTITVAGSKAAFAAIDRDLPVQIANLAHQAGATRFALVSSVGASHRGNFYLRTKAQAEAAIREVGYRSCTIVRPSMIDARRVPARRGETLGLLFARVLKPLIPKRYRAVKPEAIAVALLDGVLTASPGDHIVESEQLQG
jgi:uncharacterized protein YbjT (DUF2867 family)